MKSFLDVLVVAVLAITTINGYNKGFVRYILGTLGAVAVIVISFLVTDIFANEIYESFVQPPVTDYIAEKIEKISVSEMLKEDMAEVGFEIDISDDRLNEMLASDGDISKEISKEANSEDARELEKELNIFFEKRFPNSLNNIFGKIDFSKIGEKAEYSRNMSYDTVRALAEGDTELGAMYLEQNLVRPFAMALVNILMFILLYVVLSIVLRIVLGVTGVLDYIPLANGLNKFLGIMAGLLKGFIYLALIAGALGFVIEATGDTIINTDREIIEKTILFKYIFNFICG